MWQNQMTIENPIIAFVCFGVRLKYVLPIFKTIRYIFTSGVATCGNLIDGVHEWNSET